MSFFRKVVVLDVRLSREEVERRLRRVVRKPRTALEVLRRTPVNLPEHPDFVGTVGDGRFALSRMADVASAVGRFQSPRPKFRGVITPGAAGSTIRMEFFDLGLGVLAVGLSVAMSVTILLVTMGWPVWRPEHALIVGVIAVAARAYRYSLREDVEASTTLIQSCLSRP